MFYTGYCLFIILDKFVVIDIAGLCEQAFCRYICTLRLLKIMCFAPVYLLRREKSNVVSLLADSWKIKTIKYIQLTINSIIGIW